MKRLCGYDLDTDHYYTILVVSEEDVQNETNYRGAGFEVVILPKKFEEVENKYLSGLREVSSARKMGKIIYV